MFQTIQLSSCVSVHGEFVEALRNGEIVVRDGKTVYRGRPIGRSIRALRHVAKIIRPAKLTPLGLAR